MQTSTRMRPSDEHTFAVRREHLIERVRAFAIANYTLRLVMHAAGIEQPMPLAVTIVTIVTLLATNLVSMWLRRRGQRAMRFAGLVLTALDSVVTVYIVVTLPSIFGVGDFMVFGALIALAAARARMPGALAVWVFSSVVTLVGLLDGRGGVIDPAGDADQLFFVVVTNATVAFVVGRMAEDLHAQFDEADVLARTDALTGLANRRAFMRLLRRLHEGPQRRVTLLFIDLDGFKSVNDALGHAAGDELLAIVAQRLEQQIRRGDVGARLAGDEFVALLYDVDDPEGLTARMRAALEAPADIHGVEVRARASIGVVTALSDEVDGSGLLARADAAMYAEKARRGLDLSADPRTGRDERLGRGSAHS